MQKLENLEKKDYYEDTTPNARDYFISSLMDLIKINTENPMNIATVEQLAGAIPQNEFVNFIAFIAKSDNDYKNQLKLLHLL